MPIFKEILAKGVDSGFASSSTKVAREWYRDAAAQVAGQKNVKPNAILKQFDPKRKVSTLEPGQMYMFRYDPKHKKTLPYYDAFPVIFPISVNESGFTGLNFHYLQPLLRARLMNALYGVLSDRNFDENTRMIATYNVMNAASKYKYFKPTVKQYLFQHVRSQYLEITAKEWDIAIFLPVEQFMKESKEKVWATSRRMI